ncbi:g10747 [Coccomyxa viridis]|uniref:Protein pelota homolog n=1 Tax=Coccomyxa viridis TaxID=1274662 RepID=A0ABP1G8T7_9CHLO
MRLVSRSYQKGCEGHAKLVPEEAEDMWHVYNLVRAGDKVTAVTFRKIAVHGAGGSESERVKIKLAISVEAVDFDPEGASLRLRGKNLTETEHVKLGAYHTVELEPQRPFTLEKQAWDAIDIERIRQSTDPALSADLAAVLITEGLAHVCLVGSSTTVQKAKIESSIPRKRGAAAAGYDKALQSFFNKVYAAVERHVDWNIVRCLVIAGPGFMKDQFKEYLHAEAVRRDTRDLILNKTKIVVAQASSAYKHSLREVLGSPGIAGSIKDTKAAQEVAALQAFHAMLGQDSARAFYGPGHVRAAHELGAIQTLLISDTLFRVNNVAKRKAYAALVDGVKDTGGDALILSGAHVSGEQLDQLSGIAAILRFPLPDLEDAELDPDL